MVRDADALAVHADAPEGGDEDIAIVQRIPEPGLVGGPPFSGNDGSGTALEEPAARA